MYSASFAAVPHVVSYLATAPTKADFSFFQFPAWVEICRSKQGIQVPPDLAPAYREAIAKLPRLVTAAAERDWDENILSCGLAAIAASKGFCVVAEAVLELNSDTAREFLKWHLDL